MRADGSIQWGHDVTNFVHDLVYYNNLPKDKYGHYLVLFGSDSTYNITCDVQGAISSFDLGGQGSAWCGQHFNPVPTRYSSAVPYQFNLQYTFLKMNSANSVCNFFPHSNQTPNGNAPLDNLINLISHELVETALSSYDIQGYNLFQDGCKNEPSDKCSNVFTNLVTTSDNKYYNVIVGNEKYLVQPVWDPELNKCSMGSTCSNGLVWDETTNSCVASTGSFVLRSALLTDWCVNQDSALAGAAFRLSYCSYMSDSQMFTKVDNNGFILKRSGLAFGVDQRNVSNGVGLQQWSFTGNNTLKWSYNSADKTLRLYLLGKCLEASGTTVIINSCDPSKVSQQWYPDAAILTYSSYFSSYFSIKSTLRSSFCLNTPTNALGQGFNFWNCGPTDLQLFERGTNGAIRLMGSTMCLDVRNSQTSNGAIVQIAGCNSANNQNWHFNPFDGSFRTALAPGMCLDVSTGNTNNGAVAQLWSCDANKTSQRFVTTKPGPFSIRSNLRANFCLDNGENTDMNGQALRFWDCTDERKQTLVRFSPNDSRWRINFFKCVEVRDSSTNNGAVVQINSCGTGNNQKWYFNASDNSIRVVSAPGMCLVVADGNTANGAAAQLLSCDPNNPNQQFTIAYM